MENKCSSAKFMYAFYIYQQHRPQPFWETHQGIGSHILPEMLKGKMHFLLPGERHDLPAGDFSLLDRIARGDAVPLMPRCNACRRPIATLTTTAMA